MEPTADDSGKPSESFGGLRVAAFESRMATETAALIERFGGVAMVAPSMREVPIEDNGPAFEFAEAILAGRLDVVIFMTGVGVRELFRVIETRYPKARIIAALERTLTAARGPKPVKALRDLGIKPNVIAQEPQTWREVIAAIGAAAPIEGKRIAIQEYGAPAADLHTELERIGAHVTAVQVYRWALPVDCGPLEEAIRAIAAGERDVVLFTSATQVANLIVVAKTAGLKSAVVEGLRKMAVCSIGPICSEALKEHSIAVDLEPEHPRLGHLIKEAAAHSAEILRHNRPGNSD